jgi:hypothetical protein
MKFKQYLTEGIESLEHWDQIKTFSPESLDNIKFIFDELRTKFKKVSEEIELPKNERLPESFLLDSQMEFARSTSILGCQRRKIAKSSIIPSLWSLVKLSRNIL